MSARHNRVHNIVPGQVGVPGQPGIVPVAFVTESDAKLVVYPAEDRIVITEPPTKVDDEDLEKRFPGLAGHGGD